METKKVIDLCGKIAYKYNKRYSTVVLDVMQTEADLYINRKDPTKYSADSYHFSALGRVSDKYKKEVKHDIMPKMYIKR